MLRNSQHSLSAFMFVLDQVMVLDGGCDCMSSRSHYCALGDNL